MTKQAGDASDKITELRKEMETLRSKYDALRREVRILRSMTNSPTTLRNSTHIAPSPATGRNSTHVSASPVTRRNSTHTSPSTATGRNSTHNAPSPRARRVQEAREPSRQDILTREDREHTATFGGLGYVYRDGKPIALTDRQIKTLSLPSFMAETTAWSEKRWSQGDQTFKFLRRSNNGTPQTPELRVDMGWAESQPPTPSGSDGEDEYSVSNDPPGEFAVDTGEVTPQPAADDDGHITINAPELLSMMDLGVDLETTLGFMRIHSRPANESLDQGLFLMSSILHERAREHWPNLFRYVDQGEYLVQMCRDEMGANLALTNISDVCPNPRDGRRLWRFLREDLPRVRNKMSHKTKEYLCDTRLVELDLKDLQEAIYLLGDTERAAEIRQLRDQVKGEAEKAWNTLTDLHNRIQLPGYEIQDQDMQYMHALDQAFAEIIWSERGLSSMPITVREAMVQVAEFLHSSTQYREVLQTARQLGGLLLEEV